MDRSKGLLYMPCNLAQYADRSRIIAIYSFYPYPVATITDNVGKRLKMWGTRGMETKLHYEMPECQRSPRHIGAWNLAIPGKANYPIRPAAPPLSICPALPCLAGMFF